MQLCFYIYLVQFYEQRRLVQKARVRRHLLTFTAEPDSSKLRRKLCVRKGLNCLGPVESRLHASQSSDETSEIEETTETDTFLMFTDFVVSP